MKPHKYMELIAWTLLLAAAFCFLAACATKPEDIRPAEVVVKTRRSNGTLDTPNVSPWGNTVVTKRWEFTDSEGRKFYAAEVFTVHHPAVPAESSTHK